MKTSVSFWDSLFGEKITIELPMPNGEIRKVEVAKKWFEKMKDQGLVKPISDALIKVNILDQWVGNH